MNLYPSRLMLMLLATLSLLTASCANQPSFDEQALYVEQSEQRAITLTDVTLTPSTYWLRDTRRDHNQSKVDDLLARYQNLFSDTFADHMRSVGWTISDGAPLTASLAVSEFRISAPDFHGAMVDLYASDELGSAIWTLSLYEDDRLIARFSDRRDVSTVIPGKLEPTSRVINQQGFKRELKRFLRDTQQALKPAFQWL